MTKLTLDDLELKNKKVLIRVDYNVPMNEKHEITNTARIEASLPTIQAVLDKGASCVLFSHLGRVKTEEDKEGKSLEPIAKYLENTFDTAFCPETRGEKLEEAVAQLRPGQVLLVENTRFEDLDGQKESSNDDELASYWASLGDVFINDAFGTCHREHASNVGLASHVSQSALGSLVYKELKVIGEAIEQPKRPFILILGGSKVSDKLPVIENLIDQADYVLIGGGMAFTFLKTRGIEIGNSLLEEELEEDAEKLLDQAGEKIILPVDYVVASEIDENAKAETLAGDIPSGKMGLDIGQETIKLYQNYIKDAQTVIWNGPMGVFEVSQFAEGTKAVAQAMGEVKEATTIVGGGDSVSAVESLGYEDNFTHLSTGGGAMLDLLAGTPLPGVEAIQDK